MSEYDEYGIRISTDTKGADKDLKELSKTLEKVEGAGDKAAKSTDDLGKAADKATPKIKKASEATGSTAKGLNNMLPATLRSKVAFLGVGTAALAGAAGLVAVGVAVKGMSYFTTAAREADALKDSLRGVTDGSEELDTAFTAVVKAAQASRQPLDATLVAYRNLASVTGDLNLSIEETASLAGLVGKAMAVSGASASETASGMNRFTDAVSDGVVTTNELKQLLQETPEIFNLVAESMGKTKSQLLEFSKDSGLSAKLFVEAFTNATDKVDADLRGIPKTMAQVKEEIATEWTAIMEEIDVTTASEGWQSFSDILKDPETRGAVVSLGQSFVDLQSVLADLLANEIVLWANTIALIKGDAEIYGRNTEQLTKYLSALEKVNANSKGMAEYMGKPHTDDHRIEQVREQILTLTDAARESNQEFLKSTGIMDEWTDILGKLATAAEEATEFSLVIKESLYTEKEAAALNKFIKLREEERKQLKMNAKELYIYNALKGAEFKEGDSRLAQVREQIEADYELMLATNGTVDTVEEYIEALKEEIRVSKLSALEKARNTALSKGQALATEQGIKFTDESKEAILAQVDALYAQRDALKESESAVRENAAETDIWSDALGSALTRVDGAFADLWVSAFEGFDDFQATLKDAFIRLLAELAHEATTRKILMSFGTTLTGLPNAAGIGGVGQSLMDIGSGISAAGGVYNYATNGLASGAAGHYQGVANSLVTYSNGGGFGADAAGWYADASSQYANTVAQNPWSTTFANVGGGLVGSYAGREVFQNEDSTGIGAAGGSYVGGVIGGYFGAGHPMAIAAGAAIGAFLGEGLEKSIKELTGWKDGGKNRAGGNYDLGLGTSDLALAGKNGGANLTLVEGLVANLQVFSDNIGGSDYKAGIRMGNKDGLRVGEIKYGGDVEQFFQDTFDAIIAEADNMSDSMREFLIGFEGSAETIATTAAVLYAVLGPEGEVDGMLKTLIGNFVGSQEDVSMWIQSVVVLTELIKDNPFDDAVTNYSRANLTLLDAYTEQSLMVYNVAQEFDGTAESAARLANIVAMNGQMAYDLSIAFMTLKDSIAGLVTVTSDYFKTTIMTEEELYDHRLEQLAAIEKGLSEAQSPEEIEALIGQYAVVQRQVFDSLVGVVDPEKLKEFAETFTSDLERVAKIATTTIDTMLEQIDLQQDRQNDSLDKLLTAQAEKMGEAADGQIAASMRMKGAVDSFLGAVSKFAANANIEITIDSEGQAEVNV